MAATALFAIGIQESLALSELYRETMHNAPIVVQLKGIDLFGFTSKGRQTFSAPPLKDASRCT